jgi:hypothetical protein
VQGPGFDPQYHQTFFSAVPGICQAHCQLRAFALAGPSVQNALPPGPTQLTSLFHAGCCLKAHSDTPLEVPPPTSLHPLVPDTPKNFLSSQHPTISIVLSRHV